MIVLGSGLAGLIAADLLRDDVTAIWEAQSQVPNNHHAILRFRSSIVGDALNIPFKKVNVIKTSSPYENPAADMISYGLKVVGRATQRSIVSADGVMSERYISPPDLIPRLAKRAEGKLCLNTPFVGMEQIGTQAMVSTMPMPVLMKIMEYPKYEEVKGLFSHRGGTVIRATIPNCDVYATVYEPSPHIPFYRISITGDELYIELAEGWDKEFDGFDHWPPIDIVKLSLQKIGLWPHITIEDIDWSQKDMTYAKIDEVPKEVRQEFILWATQRGVLSLGRFATWRPTLLLDSLINDIRVVRELATGSKNPIYMESLK